MRALALIVLLLLLLTMSSSASAHGLRTGYVELTELSAGHALVRVAAGPAVVPILEGCSLGPTGGASDARGRSFVATCDGPLVGRGLRVEGLGPIVSEVAVCVSLLDGTLESYLLTANRPRWTIPKTPTSTGAIREYVGLGVIHIATGVDHLLFLLALVLALRNVRAVILAETAFTLSHTLSFSAAALGWVDVSPLAAEACIALSLVFVALEIAPRRGRRAWGGAPATSAWHASRLAFAFGLVHGLGFAGGLSEIGLPPRAIPQALIGFAMGVEVGQVAFLLVALLVVASFGRRRGPVLAGAYAIGATGVFLLFERLAEIIRARV